MQIVTMLKKHLKQDQNQVYYLKNTGLSSSLFYIIDFKALGDFFHM